MIIEQDNGGRFRRTKNRLFYFYETELLDGTFLRARRKDWWQAQTFQRIHQNSRKRPAPVLNLDDLSWWLYKGKVYCTHDHPRQSEVLDFLRDRREEADYFEEPMFPDGTAFEFPTIGERRPPRVPIAEVIERPPEKGPARQEQEKKSKGKRLRQYIPSSVKILVWRRDERRCVECGSQERLEFDHIIPVSTGGSNTARNLQLLCERCNRRKGAGIV